MLVRCKDCSQVVEVSAMIEHLLMDCEKREKYVQCEGCTDAVKTELLHQHSSECKGK